MNVKAKSQSRENGLQFLQLHRPFPIFKIGNETDARIRQSRQLQLRQALALPFRLNKLSNSFRGYEIFFVHVTER